MKNLFKAVIVFLCILNLILTDTFAIDMQNKGGNVLNSAKDIKQDYFNGITKSINDVIELYNQTLIEKTLIDYNIVDEKSSYNKKIRKGDFVKAVLKIMGVTDAFAEYVNKCVTIEYDSSKKAFSTEVRRKEQELSESEYKEEKRLYSYILLINAYQIITKGDFKNIKSYIDDDIEIEECLHIMNKCLNKEVSSEDVILEAEKNGLVKNTDEMLTKNEKTLNYEDFCTLLYRMLNHRMGYYFKYLNDYNWKYTFYNRINNEANEIRYIDHLNFIKTQDIAFDTGIYKIIS